MTVYQLLRLNLDEQFDCLERFQISEFFFYLKKNSERLTTAIQ